MPADPIGLGIVSGIDQALNNIQQIRNDNDDRAYKSLVAQMMIRKQMMDEQARGYHGGYGSLTPSGDQPAPAAAPSTDLSVPQVYSPGAASAGMGQAASRVAPPAVNVQAPSVGLRGATAAASGPPTGFSGFVARMLHSGYYAGQGLPTLPDLGSVNGLTEDEANTQAAEAARRADVLQAQGYQTTRDKTQHGYDMERQSDEDAAAMARAKLQQAGEDRRSSNSDDKLRTTELEKGLANAQVELDASARALQQMKALGSGASAQDVAAATERYRQALDRATVLRHMIGSDVGLPEEPQPLAAASGTTPELAHLNDLTVDALRRASTPEQKKAIIARYLATVHSMP